MRKATFLAGAIVWLALSPAWAAPPDGLEGTWEGFLNPSPAVEVRLVLRVDKAGEGGFQAKVEAPEFKAMGTTDFDAVSLKDGAVVLSSKATGREFRGTLDPAGAVLSGEWKKGDRPSPLTFARVGGTIPPSEIWEGMLTVNGGIKLRLAFHVSKGRDGKPRATMDSPDQGAFSLKVDSVAVDKEALKFEIKAIVGGFEGKVGPAGDRAEGHWKQAGVSFPVTLKKVAEATEVRRPQLPRPPFPYASEEVAYDSRAAGVRIAGTITMPPGDGPFPAVLLITGSGPQDRDETLLGHKPFLVLADDLTRRGIVVLRVDDRGVAASTGDQAGATSADFAEDVLAGVDFLKGRRGVDPGRIGLIGHSEGGLIAPMVAARSTDVGFLVLMAGPGTPGDRVLAAQLALILKASGADEATIRRSADSQARLMGIVKENEDPKVAVEKLRAAGVELAAALPEAERKALAASDPNGSQVARLATPWFRYFLAYDPRPTLANVRCPVLAINGEKDLQVPPGENLTAIEQALRSGGNARVTVRELAGLNHLFQPSATGAPSEYGQIEETFAPVALKVIGEWIVGLPKAP